MGRFVFKLPDVGEGTAEAELVGWHVKVGDVVAEDQIVADVMTDKATVEITAPVSGKVIALHGEPGAMVPVRGPLVEFEVEGAGNAEDAPASAPVVAKPDPAPAEAPKAEKPKAEAVAPSLAGNYVFKLPDVGEGTAEAELVGWHVKVGDAVEEDQIIADIMTDKATVEITSPVAGVVVALYGEAGQQVPVGGPLVAFDVAGAGNVQTPVQAPSVASGDTSPKGGGSAPTPAPKSLPPGGSTRAAGEGGKSVAPPALTGRTAGERPSASPAVRNRARDLGVDLTFVPGSGPAG
ncbi:MAG: biotin/lipoyl-containing protein, partial [Brevundimonas sp.]